MMLKYCLLLGPCLLSSWPPRLRAQGAPYAAARRPAAASPPPAPATPPRRLAVAVGLRLGATYSNTNFNQGFPPPAVPVATTWRAGVAAGFWLELALSKKLAVQQEYLFTQLRGEIANGGPQYTLRYLSLPLLLKYRVAPRLALVAGPQADLLIQAQQASGGQTTDITHDTEERSVSVAGGLEVRTGPHLGFSARYLQGLNHIGIGQRPAAQEFKWQSVQVAAEVRL